jgi:hypothetical protein
LASLSVSPVHCAGYNRGVGPAVTAGLAELLAQQLGRL